MEGQQPEAAIVDFDVKLIDRLVAREDFVNGGRIALHQPVEGGAHTLLGETAHFEQPALERFELLAEVGDLAIH
jgi:hypothetical protein